MSRKVDSPLYPLRGEEIEQVPFVNRLQYQDPQPEPETVPDPFTDDYQIGGGGRHHPANISYFDDGEESASAIEPILNNDSPRRKLAFGEKFHKTSAKMGRPLNKATHLIGAEGWWPDTLDKEYIKAARILYSFTSKLRY